MSRLQCNVAQHVSFHERTRHFMRSIPADLDPTGKLVLIALFTYAHEDGGGIYVGSETLCELTGLPRRTVFRQLANLSARKYLVSAGWHELGQGRRTRLRRLDFEAIQEAAGQPTQSATRGTPALTQSATHGTTQSATHGTQTERENLEGNQVILTWRPSGRLGDRQAIKKLLWQEGVAWLLDKQVRPADRQARGLMGELLKLAGKRNPDRVLSAIQEADRTDPADCAAYLIAAVSDDPPDENCSARRRRRVLVELPLTLEAEAEPLPMKPVPLPAPAPRQEARQERVDPEREAVHLLGQMSPRRSRHEVRCDVARLLARCRLPELIVDLVECSRLDPPPADPFVWMVTRGKARVHHPGSDARQ